MLVFLYIYYFFVKNINMRNIIKLKLFCKELIKNISSVTDVIHPSILSSSLVYYFLIVSIPFSRLLQYIMLIIDSNTLPLPIISLILFFTNVVYVSSKIVYALQKTTISIYKFSPYNIIVARVKSFLIVFYVILSNALYLILSYYLARYNNVLIDLIRLLSSYLVILLSFSIVIKKVIPVHIKYSKTLLLSIVTFVSFYVIKYVYYSIIGVFGTSNIIKLYGSFYEVYVLLILLYAFFTILIYVLIISYVISKKRMYK